jgi:Mlc titration factor MtfA (ptsG expression regulator)
LSAKDWALVPPILYAPSEAFSTVSHALLEEFPTLYRQLTRFHRQDPAARLPAQGRK